MEASDGGSTRSLSEISEEETARLNTDLVAAARKNLGFLRLVSEAHWLHQTPTILEAIRRYEQLWMPLIADLTAGTNSPVVLPPLDIEWIWFCHTLNPVSYRKYCEAKFSRVIGKAAIFDAENEDYAIDRCRDIWMRRYPREPFEIESDYKMENPVVINEDLFGEVSKRRFLCFKFAEPYRSEIVYLIAARHRYKGFLYIMRRFAEGQSRLVPTSDVLLMWFTHMSYPTTYMTYIKELEVQMEKVSWETGEEEDLEETKKLWENIFDEPYEKAGGEVEVSKYKPLLNWVVTDSDVNMRYKSIVPRFLVEVCLMVKLNSKLDARQKDVSHEFLRLQMVRCHRQLKINKTLSKCQSESWQKAWHLYCEFGTKGVVLEVRRRGGFCSRGSGLKDTVTFYWNDLLRAPSLTLSKEIDRKVRVVASITPPIQSSYLLKCVPDWVTDDSGVMISDFILKMNGYRPQEGRWLSRTVLDHAGRECFVVRMRVGGGFWRRGAETPSAVKWEDRIIEIRQGSWSYVAGSIGRAPEKVVGTATPKEPLEGWKASWNLSTGDELSIGWEASTSTSASGLSFHLKHETDTDSMIQLVRGRKMQYQVNKFEFKCKNGGKNTQDDEEKEEKDEGEDDGFVTLVRISEENPNGKATALLNWKLLVVELLPEEDAVLVLLLCISILRSVSEMTKEDIGRLLIRRRLKEAKLGDRDWGSVTLHPSSYSPDIFSPYLLPWHWNAQAAMASNASDAQSASGYSLVEGGDKLYKRGIIA